MWRWIFTFIIACQLGSVDAQPVREATYEMKLEAARKSVAQNNYYSALQFYQELFRESRDYDIMAEMARMYYMMRDFERASRYYDRLVERDAGDRYIQSRYEYGQCLKMLGEYEPARRMFRSFLQRTTSDSLMQRTEAELEGMNLAEEMEEPVELKATNIGDEVNTPLSEASPALQKTGALYYATFDQRAKIEVTEENMDARLQIYTAKKNEDGEYIKQGPLPIEINREGFHTGNPTFSKDEGTMYFTRAKLAGDELTESIIYMSTYDGENWGAPYRLEGVNGDFIATHPAPGELYGNPVLFFVSGMPGGKGGKDIYYAEHLGGRSYGRPVNLGATINTPGDDVTPFFHEGTLYFSSTGHPGLGGYDVFKSTWNGTSWSTPVNMGKAYNSTVDDLYFLMEDGNEEEAWLISNRPSEDVRSYMNETCCDDIFRVHKEELEIELLAIAFEDSEPLTGVTIEIHKIENGRVVDTVSKFSGKGNGIRFDLEKDRKYNVIIKKEEFYPDSFGVSTEGITQNRSIRKERRLVRSEPATEIITINEPIRLSNIYYDYDDYKILPEAEQDLRYLKQIMEDHPEIVIELSSHTDARGDDQYNIDLSQKRANSAKQWLIEHGLNSDRIVAKGYGEEKILNHCTNGVDCSEAEHRLNRRTEFKIIEGPKSIEVKKEVIRGEGESIRQNRGKKNDNPGHGMIYKIPCPGHSSPNLKFEQKFHDFGIVKAGKSYTHQFEFFNTGDADLKIDMATSCDNTKLTWPKEIISPGEKGIITATYSTEDQAIGEQEVIIDIIANTEPIIREARFRVFIEQ